MFLILGVWGVLRVRIRLLQPDPKLEFRCVVEVESCLENLGEFG